MAVTKFAKVEGFVFLCRFDIKNLFPAKKIVNFKTFN